MRKYKTPEEKAAPMNTSAPNKLIDDFLVVATDLDAGETLSEAIQLLMRYAITKKNNKSFKEEIQKLRIR